MHKFVLKTFDFLKNCAQFVQIAMLFSILLLLLYWIQNITNAQWSWLTLYTPFLEGFVETGKSISKESVTLFGAVFEYKYFIAVLLYLLIYYIAHFCLCALAWLEEVYGDSRRAYKKMVEDTMNSEMNAVMTLGQKRIKEYKIYISTSLKKKFSHREQRVDLNEQNRLLTKFLVGRTGVIPENYENGYLYSFDSFERVDQILEEFFKLIKSDTPLNYVVCVQIFGENVEEETKKLNKLIALQFINKIVTMADTVWRYKYNTYHRYGTSQLGIFQQDDDTFEAHEFYEI